MRLDPVNRAHRWLNQDDHELGVYNTWDSYSTALLRSPLRDELRDNGQLDYFDTVFWPKVEPVLAIQRRGLELDCAERDQLRRTTRAELHETERLILDRDPTGELRKPTPKHPNGLNSNDRKAAFLYDVLGLRCPKETSTGKRSVDQESLVRVLRGLRKRDEPARDVLYNLFHRSRLNTILTRYLDLKPEPDGRIRPVIKLTVETQRLAYTRPPLQQYPKEIRDVLRAADGHVFIAGDYRQLEAKIMALLAKDPTSLRTFSEGRDIHTQNCFDMFGHTQETWDALTDRAREATRNYTKSWLYKISYGGSAASDKEKLYCPCPRCEDKVPPILELGREEKIAAEQRWFSRHRATLSWREQLVQSVVGRGRDHTYTAPSGYRRFFFAPYPKVKNEILNEPMQHMAAFVIDRALRELHYAHDAPTVLQMHDELMLEVPERDAPHWARLLRKTMEKPVPEMGSAVFPVDLSMGDRWGDLRPWGEGT